MDSWLILGIEPTNDIRTIKKAYAKQCTIYHPETYPEEFKKLHNAYKKAIACVNRNSAADTANSTVLQTKNTVEQEQEVSHTNLLKHIETIARQKHQKSLEEYGVLEFEKQLKGEGSYYIDNWMRYFSSHTFLKHQYHVEYINGIADVITKYIKTCPSNLPAALFMSLTICYGLITNLVRTEEDGMDIPHPIAYRDQNVYHMDVLTNLSEALKFYNDTFNQMLKLEKSKELMSYRFAYYLYRSICVILDKEETDRAALKKWILKGFYSKNTDDLHAIMHFNNIYDKTSDKAERLQNSISCHPIIFELLAFLVTERKDSSECLIDVLKEICGMNIPGSQCEELEILELLLEEL